MTGDPVLSDILKVEGRFPPGEDLMGQKGLTETPASCQPFSLETVAKTCTDRAGSSFEYIAQKSRA